MESRIKPRGINTKSEAPSMSMYKCQRIPIGFLPDLIGARITAGSFFFFLSLTYKIKPTTMTNKITIKQAKRFTESFTKRILQMGATSVKSTTSSHTAFVLNTIVGLLTIHLPIEQTFCFTVFSIFENEKEAAKKFDCNKFSGKYNFHRGLYKGETVDNIVEMALMHFNCTLPK